MQRSDVVRSVLMKLLRSTATMSESAQDVQALTTVIRRLHSMSGTMLARLATVRGGLTAQIADSHPSPDWSQVTVGGSDIYSAMKTVELEPIAESMHPGAMSVVRAEFLWDERGMQKCLRWICRGLSPKNAVRKVLHDRATSESIKRRERMA